LEPLAFPQLKISVYCMRRAGFNMGPAPHWSPRAGNAANRK